MATQKNEKVDFTADRVGSEVLERFSADIYQPKAIVRELVKNAYDSYFQLEHYFSNKDIPFDLNDEDREINIALAADTLVIKDKGIGANLADLRKMISIALTDKREIDGVSGFRGIGFWSAYTAGDFLTVRSKKVDEDRVYTLRLNTRRMRELQGPHISLGRIMNDDECVSITSERADHNEGAKHFTEIYLHADGEDCRLRDLIADSQTLRRVLLDGCCCGLHDEADTQPMKAVRAFYDSNQIKLCRLVLGTEELTRSVPDGLGNLQQSILELKHDGKRVLLAKYWHLTNQENEIIDSPFAGLRVFYKGFPIGKPNLYSDKRLHDSQIELGNTAVLNWHFGEIHLSNPELQPDASGEQLRDTIAAGHFREELRHLYDNLIQVSYGKQRLKSKIRDYHGALATLSAVKDKRTLSVEESQKVKNIHEMVRTDVRRSKGKLKSSDQAPGNAKLIARDSSVKKLRKAVSDILSNMDYTSSSKEVIASSSRRSAATTEGNTRGAAPGSTGNVLTVAAMIDKVRDVILEVLGEQPDLCAELLERVNDIMRESEQI